MNALQQPSRYPSQPVKRARVSQQQIRQRQARRYQVMAVESSVKLAVNLLLSGAAIVALVQLLPHQLSQRAKLQDLRAEVGTTEQRVSRLRSDFNRYFDPYQARSIMQEQTNRVDANQRAIIWDRPLSDQSAQLP